MSHSEVGKETARAASSTRQQGLPLNVAFNSTLYKQVEEYFPYAKVRPFQDKFVNTIFEAVNKQHHVLIEGSNGLGKTVAALSACLPVAKERDLQILYVAKTHRQHDRVMEELGAIAKHQDVSGLSIRGRTDMCFHPLISRHAPDAKSAMEICELLKSRKECPYFASIETKEERFVEVKEHIASKVYKASDIQEICRAEGFCPYELVKQALENVDVVALSYMYVFDSSIRGHFLKHLDRPLSEVILIVDEAHNLPETAVDIASDRLTLFALRQAELEAQRFRQKGAAEFANKFRIVTEKMAAQIEKESYVSPNSLIHAIKKKIGIDEPEAFFEEMHETGNLVKQQLLKEGKYPRSFIHRVSEFLLKWLETSEDDAYTHVLSKYVSKTGASSAKLEVVALDPSKVTEPVFSSVYCSVCMSGTLQPLESYVKITHLPESTVSEAVPSPFPREHILSMVCCGVTTAMQQRTPGMYEKLAKRILEVAKYTPANVGVFTASYEVLQRLLETGLQNSLEKPLLHEHRGMSSRENDKLVARFKSYARRGGAVLLGVQGGRSSEGADYPGDEMNSVAVVGLPYAEPTARVAAQIKYYERCFPEQGREYGYVVPALKKAAQAAGRPIRTLEDRGAIVFLDHRFATAYCQSFLPLWIRRGIKTLPDEDDAITHELKEFYNTKEN
jgi:DNA excision repair protein ERCC-2